MPTYVLICPACDTQYKIKKYVAEKKIRCKRCRSIMMIPSNNSGPAALQAATAPPSAGIGKTLRRSRWIILSSFVSLALLVVTVVIAVQKWREPKPPADGVMRVSDSELRAEFNRYNKEALLPLATGMEWVYASEGTNASMKIRRTFYDKTSHSYRALLEIIKGKSMERKLLMIRSDGVYLVEEDDTVVFHRYDPPMRIIKHPLKEGDRWTWTGAYRNLNDDSSEQWNLTFIVEGRETLNVSDRIFTSLRLRTTGTKGRASYDEKAWYAVASGMIRRIVKTGAETEEWRLTTFKTAE